MKFMIYRASDCGNRRKDPNCDGAYREGDYWYIDINSMEELISLNNKCGYPLIFDVEDKIQLIEIYDDYIE